eukprot:TRINITY_DN149_c0_g1_i3.p1 TRINITY_DN149_c0_g1~~TRINITY_DN149_c0_g1_i3.p1  ORF type:complete len:114 (+),score=33.97 TRINITY_DN149_c0_g1_i3:3-344(+)
MCIRDSINAEYGTPNSKTHTMRPLTPVNIAAARIFGTRIGNYAHKKSGNKVFRQKLRGPRMADYYSTPLKQMNLPGFVDMEKMVRVNRRERQAKRLALKQSAGSQQPMGKGKK